MPHPPTSDSPATGYASFLRYYALTTIGVLLGCVLINVIVDPLWVYHAPWLPQTYVIDQRQGNPGLARFLPYDAVVIGNSLTENFLVSEMQSQLGWQPIKLCIAGSTVREQHLILDQALATGQVRDVLWSIDFDAFERGPDTVRIADFPFHLYNRNATTACKYLLSVDTLQKSIMVLTGGGAKSLESRHVWHQNHKFDTDHVLTHWRSKIARDDWYVGEDQLTWRSAQAHLLPIIQSYPKVRFHFVFQPYSALYRVAELTAPGDRFAARMRFKQKIAERLLEFPNVEVFDFEISSITHDLDRYTDLVHYNLDTSNAISRWMSEGTYRVTSDTIDDSIRAVERDTYDYAISVFSPDNPLRTQLLIEESGLQLPAALAVRLNEKRAAPVRTAVRQADPSR